MRILPALRMFLKPGTTFWVVVPLILLWSSCFAQIRPVEKPVILLETENPRLACYDVTSYLLDLDIDPAKHSVTGSCTMYFMLLSPIDSIDLFLDNRLGIKSITDTVKTKLSFSRLGDRIRIVLPGYIHPGQTNWSITLQYGGIPKISANPPWDGGFVWSTDGAGNPFCGVTCQLEGARLWWPNKNVWSDKPDSIAFIVSVPRGLMAISNGKLRKSWQSIDGRLAFNWIISYPILPYNLTVYIGKYDHFNEYLHHAGDSLILDYYVLPPHASKAKEHFKQAGSILEVFEKYFGPYPFRLCGYKLVEAPYQGMEHQTAIAYGNRYVNGYNGFNFAPFQFDYDYVILHETAHEWWGNSVSARKAQDIWIQESFATYSESLFVEALLGHDSAERYIMQDVPNLMKNSFPLCDTIRGTAYTSDLYDKGSAIWNTFRNMISNDSLWFCFLRQIQQDNRYGSISTGELIRYVNSHFPSDYDWFFDQYVFSPYIPVLLLKKEADFPGRISFKWDACATGFRLPIVLKSGSTTLALKPSADWQSIETELTLAEMYQLLIRRYLVKVKVQGV